MIETHPTLAQQEFIAKEMLHRRNVRILRIMLLVLLLALWELCARLGIINDFIFSSPSRMTICFIGMVKDGTIFLHTGVTVMETLVSFALVVVVGLATAILLWSSRSVSEVLEPYLIILTSRPGRMKGIVPVSFGEGYVRPLERRNTPEFSTYFNQVWKELQTHD